MILNYDRKHFVFLSFSTKHVRREKGRVFFSENSYRDLFIYFSRFNIHVLLCVYFYVFLFVYATQEPTAVRKFARLILIESFQQLRERTAVHFISLNRIIIINVAVSFVMSLNNLSNY